MSRSQLVAEAVSLNEVPKTKQKSKSSREEECENNTIEHFRENLQNLIPRNDPEGLSEEYSSDSDEDVTDADSDMKLILEALQKDEKAKRSANKTFSEDKLRDIERRNSLLMGKILAHSRRPSQYSAIAQNNQKVSSATINRKNAQKRIDHDNLVSLHS